MTNSNYRNALANDLKQLRNRKRIPIIQKSGRELAQNMLKEEKKTDEYKEAKLKKLIDLLENPEGKLTKKLNKEMAMELIKSGKGNLVAKNLEKFEGLHHEEIVSKLIEKLNKEMAIELIKAGKGHYIVSHLEKFEGLDYKEIVSKLIEKGDGRYIINDIEKINLDPKDIANIFFEKSKGHDVVEHLEKFEGLDLTKTLSYYHEESGIGRRFLNSLDKNNQVRFSYDKEKADKADVVILYRDNSSYGSMMSALNMKNSSLLKRGKGKNIYIVCISPEARGVQNIDDLKKFITTYKPLTDYTISERSGLQTEKMRFIDEKDSLRYLPYIGFLNELCKKNNIKKVYLFAGYDNDPNHKDCYRYLLEHGGFQKENGEYKYYNHMNSIPGYNEKDISFMQKSLDSQVQVWKDLMPDVEIEIIRSKRDRFKIIGFDKKLETDNSLFLCDSHARHSAEFFESMGGKTLSSTLYDISDSRDGREKMKQLFPEDEQIIDNFYNQNNPKYLINNFLEKIGLSYNEDE